MSPVLSDRPRRPLSRGERLGTTLSLLTWLDRADSGERGVTNSTTSRNYSFPRVLTWRRKKSESSRVSSGKMSSDLPTVKNPENLFIEMSKSGRSHYFYCLRLLLLCHVWFTTDLVIGRSLLQPEVCFRSIIYDGRFLVIQWREIFFIDPYQSYSFCKVVWGRFK